MRVDSAAMERIWELDLRLLDSINRGWHSPEADRFFAGLTLLGLDYVLVPLLLPLFFLSSTRRAALVAILSWAAAGLLNLLFKDLVARPRPSNLEMTLVASDEQIYTRSFPSGHTVCAFAIAFALALALQGKARWLAGATALTLAAGVGLSRIYRGVHWPSDVAASTLLALAVAWTLNSWIPDSRTKLSK